MATLQELAQATKQARAASGVEVCTRAKAGRVQVGYLLGRKFIDCSGLVSVDAALQIMGEIERDKGFH